MALIGSSPPTHSVPCSTCFPRNGWSGSTPKGRRVRVLEVVNVRRTVLDAGVIVGGGDHNQIMVSQTSVANVQMCAMLTGVRACGECSTLPLHLCGEEVPTGATHLRHGLKRERSQLMTTPTARKVFYYIRAPDASVIRNDSSIHLARQWLGNKRKCLVKTNVL